MRETGKTVDISYLRETPDATPDDISISWFELAVRSKAAGLFYLPAAISLVCFTPELLALTWLLPVTLILFGAISWWRISTSSKLEALADRLCQKARRNFEDSARVSALLMSLLVASTVYLAAGWQRWYALAIMGAFVAAVVASMCPDFSLFCQYTGLLIGLPIAAIVVRGDEQGIFVGCVVALFSCVCAIIAFVSNRNYWRSLLTTRRHLKDLARARERLELVLEASNFGTFDWLPEQSRIYISDHLPKALGLDPADFDPYEGPLQGLICKEDFERAGELLVDILKSPDEAAGEMELRFAGHDGKPRWFLFRGRVVQRDEEGQATRAAGTYQHITTRVEAEAALKEMKERMEQTEKLKTLGVLAGGVAHDFNNLLLAIHGNIELAEDGKSDEDNRECLEHARRASLEASELCDQLLAYAGKGRFSESVFNLNDLVRGMSQLLKVSVGKNCELNLDLFQRLPNVKGDVSQIRQVLMNLLTNASEAMEETGGRIELRTRLLSTQESKSLSPEVASSNGVCLEVSDEGCGMDEETVRRIFDPFYTTKFMGRGLGLATVLGIARNHGGDILVDSKVDGGTTFRLLLPVCHEASSQLPSTVVPLSDKPETILVVDDEEPVRRISSLILTKVGHQVLEAENGLEALELLGAHRSQIAVVLLDLTMPQKDGYETLLEIRELWPGLPVVLSSGYSADDVMQRAQASVQGYLKKPFTREELLTAVGQVIR